MQGNAKCKANETNEAASANEAESPSLPPSPPSSQPPADRPRRRYRRSTQPDRPRLVDDVANQSIWIVGFECGVLGPYELSRAGRAEARSDLAGVARFYADELPAVTEKTDEK